MLYEYCSNDPINRTDRSGLAEERPEDDAQGPSLPRVDYLELVRTAGEVASTIVDVLQGVVTLLTDPSAGQAGEMDCFEFRSKVLCGEMKIGVMPIAPKAAPLRTLAARGSATSLRADILSRGVTAIGERQDTLKLLGTGINVLNDPHWTQARNMAWVDEAIARGDRVFLASPTRGRYFWNYESAHGIATIYKQEFDRFMRAGYVREGDWLLPPH